MQSISRYLYFSDIKDEICMARRLDIDKIDFNINIFIICYFILLPKYRMHIARYVAARVISKYQLLI